MQMTQGAPLATRIRCFSMERGEHAFQNCMSHISGTARQVAHKLIQNMTREDMIDELAYGDRLDGGPHTLTEADRIQARRRYEGSIAEIQAAFGV